jgi:rubredoxin
MMAEKEVKGYYMCVVCGYLYKPEKGDPGRNIPPGTPFEELPDTWCCPVCGTPKKRFKFVE